MIEIEIPGLTTLHLEKLVLDMNGTLARDGKLASSTRNLLNQLSEKLELFVITADTFGIAEAALSAVSCQLFVIDKTDQAYQKQEFVKHLGAQSVVAVGNGQNDRLMLYEAALSFGIVGAEGASWQALSQAKVIFNDIDNALETLLKPKRLIATLRE
jgi:soluble P-type ATPase